MSNQWTRHCSGRDCTALTLLRTSKPSKTLSTSSLCTLPPTRPPRTPPRTRPSYLLVVLVGTRPCMPNHAKIQHAVTRAFLCVCMPAWSALHAMSGCCVRYSRAAKGLYMTGYTGLMTCRSRIVHVCRSGVEPKARMALYMPSSTHAPLIAHTPAHARQQYQAIAKHRIATNRVIAPCQFPFRVSSRCSRRGKLKLCGHSLWCSTSQQHSASSTAAGAGTNSH